MQKIWNEQIVSYAITAIQQTSVPKPIANGIYIFTVIPSDGLPSGVQLNDIARLLNDQWLLSFTYIDAPATIQVGLTTPITYIKDGTTWQSYSEAAQDAVGGILTDTSTIDFTYNDSSNQITADVINNSITNAKLAQAVANTYKGNATGATANISDIATNTAFNRNFETTTSVLTKPSRTASVGSSNNIIRADAVFPIDSKKQNRIISVANESAMLALVEDEANNILLDVGNTRVYRQDEQTTYQLTGTPASSISSWTRESGIPVWISTTIYSTANIFVKRNHDLYRSKSAVPVNQDPELDTVETYWELVGDATVEYIRTMAQRSSDGAGGIVLVPIESTVNFRSSAGNFYKYNNYRSETSIAYTAQNPVSFDVYTRTGLYLSNQTAFSSTVYDVAGTATTFAANGDASIALFLIDPNNANKFAILLGQTLYANDFATAKTDTPFASLIIPSALSNYKIFAKFAYRKDLTGSGNKFSDATRFYWFAVASTGANATIPYITWNEVTGTSQALATDSGYIANNASLVTLTLPTTCSQGKMIKIVGKGAGGWKIAQNAGQTINWLGFTTTAGTGGSVQNTSRYDSIELLCTTANTAFTIISCSVSNLNIV